MGTKTVILVFLVTLQFLAAVMLLVNPCHSASEEQIRAEMKRIDGQVTRIDREIAAMRKDLQSLRYSRDSMQSMLLNPEVYPWPFASTGKEDLFVPLSGAHIDQMAHALALKGLLTGYRHPNIGSQDPVKIKEWLVFKSRQFKEKIRYEIESVLKRMDEIEKDIAQQEREKRNLTDRFVDLDGQLKALSGRQMPTRQQAEQRFDRPMLAGVRLDWCHTWATNCGKAAADEFCKKQHYSGAVSWGSERVQQTRVISTDQICQVGKNSPICDAFTYIICK